MSGGTCGICHRIIHFDTEDYVTQVKTTLKRGRGGSPYHMKCAMIVVREPNAEGKHDEMILIDK